MYLNDSGRLSGKIFSGFISGQSQDYFNLTSIFKKVHKSFFIIHSIISAHCPMFKGAISMYDNDDKLQGL
jgi:hypothetical protein